MDPYKPANLTSETAEMFPTPTRPLSAVFVAIASVALAIAVIAGPYFTAMQDFYRPRFGTTSPLLLVLPGVCMVVWLFKPSARLLMLAALLFFLIGSIYYFRTTAHTTLWGTVDIVMSSRGDRLDSSLFWCVFPFIGCGLFLAFVASRLVLLAAKCEVPDSLTHPSPKPSTDAAKRFS
jgi:TRAP-type C4-dicarboxylate transport system permease small subunit